MKQSLVLMASVLFLLSGCQANDDSVSDFIRQAHQKTQARSESLPEGAQFTPAEFVMAIDRVPFDRPMPEVASSGKGSAECWQPDPARRPTQLEAFPLEQYQLKGIIGDQKQRWGLVFTPEGKLVKVGAGQFIGLNHGRIKRVTGSAIELKETLPDGLGCWYTRPVKLVLSATQPAAS